MDLRKKIVDTAKRLAMADGLFNLSVQELVSTGEFTEEDFYKFFKDANELIMELLRTRFGLNNNEDILKLPIEEKIKMFTVQIITQLETTRVRDFRKWLQANIHIPVHTQILSDKELLKKFLQLSVDTGELSSNAPLDDIVELIISCVYGMGLNWCMTNAKFEPLDHIDAINDLILNSLIPYLIK